MTDRPALLEARGLTRHFPTRGRGVGPLRAVDGIDLDVRAGESLGVVGESGCGKSTTARLLTRLDTPTAGAIRYDGRDITTLPERALRPYRREIQMVFQDPTSCLNPRHTVATILTTPLTVHGLHRGRELDRVRELLDLVGLAPDHLHRYPAQLSGGQRQRVGIARALAVEPRVVIADEPVSALDVSVQAQVLNLLARLQRDLDLAVVLIAHDLGVVRHVSDRVAVMYLGRIVETGRTQEVFARPQHPYTQALLAAMPDLASAGAPRRPRATLAGDPPSPSDPPSGCRFRTRCPMAVPSCATTDPALEAAAGEVLVACHRVPA